MYRVAARSIARSNLSAPARRRMATAPPPGAPPTGTRPASQKPDHLETAPTGTASSTNWPLILLGSATLVGGVWWYTSTPADKADVEAKASELGHAVETRANDVRREAEQQGKDAQASLEQRYNDTRAKIVNAVDRAENKVENAFSSTARDAQHKVEQVKNSAQAEAEKAKSTASSWFGWGSKKADEAKEKIDKSL